MTGRQNDLRILPQTREQKFIGKTLYFYQIKKRPATSCETPSSTERPPQRPAGFIGHRQKILPKKLCKTNRTFSRDYSSAGLRKPTYTPVPPYFSERSRSDGFPPPRSFPPAGLAGSFPGDTVRGTAAKTSVFPFFIKVNARPGPKD